MTMAAVGVVAALDPVWNGYVKATLQAHLARVCVCVCVCRAQRLCRGRPAGRAPDVLRRGHGMVCSLRIGWAEAASARSPPRP